MAGHRDCDCWPCLMAHARYLHAHASSHAPCHAVFILRVSGRPTDQYSHTRAETSGRAITSHCPGGETAASTWLQGFLHDNCNPTCKPPIEPFHLIWYLRQIHAFEHGFCFAAASRAMEPSELKLVTVTHPSWCRRPTVLDRSRSPPSRCMASRPVPNIEVVPLPNGCLVCYSRHASGYESTFLGYYSREPLSPILAVRAGVPWTPASGSIQRCRKAQAPTRVPACDSVTKEGMLHSRL